MAAAADEPKNYAVDVTRIDVSPNQCPIDSPLNLDVDFSVALPVEAGTWSVKVRQQYRFGVAGACGVDLFPGADSLCLHFIVE